MRIEMKGRKQMEEEILSGKQLGGIIKETKVQEETTEKGIEVKIMKIEDTEGEDTIEGMIIEGEDTTEDMTTEEEDIGEAIMVEDIEEEHSMQGMEEKRR